MWDIDVGDHNKSGGMKVKPQQLEMLRRQLGLTPEQWREVKRRIAARYDGKKNK